MKQPKVHVFTRAYNAEATIRRTIESVLNQTYTNLAYVIRDNGSTDQTYAICQEYAQKDDRIILVRNAKNNAYESDEDRHALDTERGIRYGWSLGEEDFACLLDADDEYLPDFFERAVRFAQEKDLDIVAGGSQLINEETGDVHGEVVQPVDLVISEHGFSVYFPVYLWNLRQVWGKLYRRNTVLGLLEYMQEFREKAVGGEDLPYGADTINALYSFQRARRVGILGGCYHRYYRQGTSVSYVLHKNRVDADWILHQAMEQFLIKKCGFVSAENQRFLAGSYAIALYDTLLTISHANLPADEKLHEIRRMVEHPVAKANAQYDIPQNHDLKNRWLNMMLDSSLPEGDSVREDFRVIMEFLSPSCAPAITPEALSFLRQEPELSNAVHADNCEMLIARLIELVCENKWHGEYDLCAMIQALSANNPLLTGLCDLEFLRQFGDVYYAVWQEHYVDALDRMTGLLLDGAEIDEAFLQLYLNLAAMSNQPEAFVFGKICLAKLKFLADEKEACLALLDDLAEMGVEDDEDITAMRSALRR